MKNLKSKNKEVETCSIKFLNKEKNFQVDVIEFTGGDMYSKAIEWGKKNLENFNLDMIN